MWQFTDAKGVRWDVALSRESWGVWCAILVPSGGDGALRAPLVSDSERDAVAELDGLSPEGWAELLAGATSMQA